MTWGVGPDIPLVRGCLRHRVVKKIILLALLQIKWEKCPICNIFFLEFLFKWSDTRSTWQWGDDREELVDHAKSEAPDQVFAVLVARQLE